MIFTRRGLQEKIDVATYPLKRKTEELEKKLTETEQQKQRVQEERNAKSNELQNVKSLLEITKNTNIDLMKRMEILEDTIDRFNSKSYDKAIRHETFKINYTRIIRKERDNKITVWAVFSVMLPVAVKLDSVPDALTAWQDGKEYEKKLRKEMNSKDESDLYLTEMSFIDNKGWLGKYEIKIDDSHTNQTTSQKIRASKPFSGYNA